MPDSPESLARRLNELASDCPICGGGFMIPNQTVMFPAGDATELPLLRAVCKSCGFLGWFHRGVPESLPE